MSQFVVVFVPAHPVLSRDGPWHPDRWVLMEWKWRGAFYQAEFVKDLF